MKKGMIFLMVFSLQMGYLFANSNDTLIQKQIFLNAKIEIENMLNGQSPLDFEKAVFITENAYWNNEIDYKKYKTFLDLHALNIQNIAELNRKEKEQDFTATFLETEEQKQKKYNDLLYNWAIYSYFSDTTYYNYKLKDKSKLFHHKPFQYPNNDPFAKLDWKQSQVLNLLANSSGNCYAQVNLFKIFANRFNTDAKICTAPSHIFIVHNDQKDRQHNLELGTNSFPGSGSIMTLTYTPTDAVRSGIAMRELNQKQSIALNLVYLAKAYEDKFNTKTDKFIYNCAITTLKYDPKNLNAMLLQAEYLEEKIINKNKSVKELQNDNDFIEYEKLIVSLYDNGYREMPLDMKNIIVSRLRNEEAGIIYKDHTPKGFTNPKLNDNRYITLSNGLFDELHAFKPIEQYSRTLLDAKNKKIKDFVKADTLYNNYPLDPVVFAWAVDPLASKYPHQSPYSTFNNNPIIYIDPDGREGIVVTGQPGKHTNKQHFLINGLYKAQAAQKRTQRDGEQVTWLVYSDGSKEYGHDPQMLKEYQAKAKELGINMMVVSTEDEIVDYVNEKNGGDSRANDNITSFYYVGHSTPGDLDVGYGGSGDNFEPDDFNSEAFASGAHVNLVGGCRTAIPGLFEDSNVTQFKEILDNKSNVYGSDVKVFYPGNVVSDEKLVKYKKPDGTKVNGNIVHKKGELPAK